MTRRIGKPLIDPNTGEIFLTPAISPDFTFSEFVRDRAGRPAPEELCQQEWHNCWLRQEWEEGWRVSASLMFYRERLDHVRITFDDAPEDAGWAGRTTEHEAHTRQYQEDLLARDLARSSRPLWLGLLAGSPLVRLFTRPEHEYGFSWGTAASRFDGREGCHFIHVQYYGHRK